MATVRLKDLFPIRVLLEIATTPAQTDYDITGVDLNKAQYFYKKPTESFTELNQADRTIITEGNQQTLRIKNQSLLDDIDFLQVAVKREDTSYEYNPNGSPSLDILIEAYNELVRVFQGMQDYNQKTLMICDTPSMTKILPKLKDGEAWVYYSETNEFKGFPVADLNKIADDQIVRMKQVLDTYIADTLKPDLDTYVTGAKFTQLDNYILNSKIPQLDTYTTVKETQLDDHTTAKLGILDGATSQHLSDLQDKFDTLIDDHGVVPNGTDVLTLPFGRHWVLDSTLLVNMPDVEEPDDNRGYLEVNLQPSTGNNMIIYYPLNGNVKVNMYNGSWTGWSPLGGGAIDYIPVGFLGAGFKFAPVMHNGSAWVLADETGAEGIAVDCNTSNGKIYFAGSCTIPTGVTDAEGVNYKNNEWYFLKSNGTITGIKPLTGLWQVLGKVSGGDPAKSFFIQMSDPEDITPLVQTPEGKTPIVLRSGWNFEQKGIPTPINITDIGRSMFVYKNGSVAGIESYVEFDGVVSNIISTGLQYCNVVGTRTTGGLLVSFNVTLNTSLYNLQCKVQTDASQVWAFCLSDCFDSNLLKDVKLSDLNIYTAAFFRPGVVGVDLQSVGGRLNIVTSNGKIWARGMSSQLIVPKGLQSDGTVLYPNYHESMDYMNIGGTILIPYDALFERIDLL